MSNWLPLFVAAIGVLGGFGVAYWNSRGESGELRQLMKMNEALSDLGESPARESLERARDEVAYRVAERVLADRHKLWNRLVIGVSVVCALLGVQAIIWNDRGFVIGTPEFWIVAIPALVAFMVSLMLLLAQVLRVEASRRRAHENAAANRPRGSDTNSAR